MLYTNKGSPFSKRAKKNGANLYKRFTPGERLMVAHLIVSLLLFFSEIVLIVVHLI